MEGHGINREVTPAQIDSSTLTEESTITLSQEASLLGEHGDEGKTMDTSDQRSNGTNILPPVVGGGQSVQHNNADMQTPKTIVMRAPNMNGPTETIGKLLPEANGGQQQTSTKRGRNRSRTNAQRRLARINRQLKESSEETDLSALPQGGKRGRISGETPPSVGRPQKVAYKMAAPPAKDVSEVTRPVKPSNRLTGAVRNRIKARKAKPSISTPRNADNSGEGPNMTLGPTVDAEIASASTDKCQDQTSQTVTSNTDIVAEETSHTAEAVEGTSATQQKEVGQTATESHPNRATYADAMKDGPLSMAVINAREDDGYTAVTPAQYQILQQAITMHMLKTLGKERGPPPTFEESRLTGGVLKVKCTTESKGWLVHNVPKIQTKDLWPEAKLKVVEFNRIPKPFKYFVKVPGGISKTGEVFKLLELQNPGVKTDGWAIIRRDVNENRNISLIVGVDLDSFNYIREKNGQLFCGLGRASFTIIKGSVPKATTTSTQGRVATSNPPEVQPQPTSQSDEVENIEVDA